MWTLVHSRHNKQLCLILSAPASLSFLRFCMTQATGTSATDVRAKLSRDSGAVFDYLPSSIADQLLLDRDAHGNVNVSRIETEKLLCQCVEQELEKLRAEGRYDGKFQAEFHFLGYEGRSGLPSLFDSSYCYALGYNAGALLRAGVTGYMSTIMDLYKPVLLWRAGGTPLTQMMNMERRKGKRQPVIKKALTELDGLPFRYYEARRDLWAVQDAMESPGPIQFRTRAGRGAPFDIPITLRLEYEQRKAAERAKLSEGKDAATKAAESLELTVAVLAAEADALRGAVMLRGVDNEFHSPRIRSWTRKAVQSSEAHRWRTEPHRYSEAPVPATAMLTTAMNPQLAKRGRVRIGVAFCARHASGCMNLLEGLLTAVQQHHPDSQLIGFLSGADGLHSNDCVNLTHAALSVYANQGGVDLLGHSNEKDGMLDSSRVLATAKTVGLDALVLVGGTATLRAALDVGKAALTAGSGCRILAVPATIDASVCGAENGCLGFDSACQVNSQLIGNIATDSVSAKKYFHFVRLLTEGRHSAGHVALECGLQTHPTKVLLGERLKGSTLRMVVNYVSDLICERANFPGGAKNYGIIVLPGNYLAWLPEDDPDVAKLDDPEQIHTEPEVVLAKLVVEELQARKKAGSFSGSFAPLFHHFGLEARCPYPTNFDASLGRTLGCYAACIACNRVAGVADGPLLLSCTNLHRSVAQWVPAAVPLATASCSCTKLSAAALAALEEGESAWRLEDCFANPGPIQFAGPSVAEGYGAYFCPRRPLSLALHAAAMGNSSTEQ
eukprot:INCI10247.1.p1 GENE.INCI10247.1~~INCI10247.1.p1  ORF type:complete len:782 (-),score=125.81 INCI10247.1:156-2501(-)